MDAIKKEMQAMKLEKDDEIDQADTCKQMVRYPKASEDYPIEYKLFTNSEHLYFLFSFLSFSFIFLTLFYVMSSAAGWEGPGRGGQSR